MRLFFAPPPRRARNETGRAFRDPADEFRQPGMRAQRVYARVIPRQFSLRQSGVDLVMADLVKQDRGSTFTAFQLGDQMMMALPYLRRNGPLTQWANRIGCGLHVMKDSAAWPPITGGRNPDTAS